MPGLRPDTVTVMVTILPVPCWRLDEIRGAGDALTLDIGVGADRPPRPEAGLAAPFACAAAVAAASADHRRKYDHGCFFILATLPRASRNVPRSSFFSISTGRSC